MEIVLTSYLKRNNYIHQIDLETIEKNYLGKLSMEKLWRLVCREFNTSAVERNRAHVNVIVRQAFYYLSQDLSPRKSLSEIGKFCGGYDHATVIHGKKTIRNLLTYDKDLKKRIVSIMSKY